MPENDSEPERTTPPRRAAVVINPAKSGGPELQREILRLCETQGWAEPLWLETSIEDPGTGQARQALEAGVDVVIAAGGDGTVRCVAEVLAGTKTPMGLVPLGTGNLLARNLGVDISDPVAACRGVLTGSERTIDVVKATLDHSDEQQLFLVMAGLGYDAAIMADTVDVLKDRMGWVAYVEAGIRKLPGKPVKAKISVDGGKTVQRRIRSVMIGNCGRIMGGVEIFPDAKFDDGVLDLLVLAPRGRFGWLGVVAGIFGRNKRETESVEYFQGKAAEITLEREQEFQLDGDHLGAGTHLAVAIDRGALTIRMAG
ncbi:diacylglycerol kinase family protein [Arthrobacter sp. AL08]|uniref:diacylglycerol/lipid kinase family protein n=1 Tax=Micrococcaceae TaxID=1268 RepID=UPI001CFF97F2|nr:MULTISPECIES: diacylglycerol kinase family protein [Micrococcaceae]MCB5283054.1 Diacylglycerol kinase [Arthrobacter sp. ES1]MDI3241996.1 diacylglycerol kinase family protein [Arthrobacter sp. AL05]MDI3278064.1 diacylglycerol kinase family protein [Arthrobacter sp. AL08]MDJ0352578.1 diacylglycerol kinase family protein [Pseudarthrobacter sp. PH31-O2]WGZ79329.1 diacylglycerol kinase family protein [Arthrobacter sp. EM1]